MTDGQTTDHHRQGDVVLEGVRGELALLKQASELGTKASDARFDGLGRSIDALGVKLDRVIDGQTEPGASAAGRALLEKITANEKSITEHEMRLDAFLTFQTTVLASIKTFRAQMVVIGFVLGLVSGLTAVITFLGRVHP